MKLEKIVKGIIAILLLFITFYLLVSSIPFIEIGEPKMVEGKIYHTTDIADINLSKPIIPVPIEKIDCYYSLQKASIFSDEVIAPVTGTITLSDDNYRAIIEKYDDWRELTGFPLLDLGVRDTIAIGIQEYSCNDLKDFLKTETYLYSDQFTIDEQVVFFVSKSKNVVYFYFS